MSVKHPWRDRDKLYELYKEKEMTQGEVADEWDCSRTTIRKWLEKHEIEKHDHDELVADALEEYYDDRYPWHDEEKLYKMYVEKEMSCIDIAEEFGCGDVTILRWLNKHDIPIRSRSDAVHLARDGTIKGISHYYDERGYEVIKGRSLDTKLYVHRWTAYAHTDLSFDEFSQMVTHHKNEIKWDNRPENLSLMENEEHAKHHHG